MPTGSWGMGNLANNIQYTDAGGEGEPCLVLPLRDWAHGGRKRGDQYVESNAQDLCRGCGRSSL